MLKSKRALAAGQVQTEREGNARDPDVVHKGILRLRPESFLDRTKTNKELDGQSRKRTMKACTLAFLATAAAAAPSPEIPYSQWMTDSMIRNGYQLAPTFHYDEATLYTSFEAVYDANKNETVLDFYRSHVYAVVLEDGTIDGFNHSHYSLDNYRFGNNILWWYERTGEERFKIAAGKIKDQLDRHPRTPTGGFWHRRPTYPNQMWLDGIYMADTFYAKWTRLFQPANATAWDDIALQFDTIDARTREPATELRVHGYDEGKTAVWADPVTGAAPLVWARAVGWYVMALLEVAALLPAAHPARERLLGYFRAVAGGLRAAQDETGGWWNVMSEPYPGRPGNYIESSASVMFTFALLKGLRLGILPKEEFTETAAKAYRGMVDMFVTENDDGTLNWEKTVEVGSLGSNATFEYYSSIKLRQNDLRGGGVFMLAALEWESRTC